MELTCQWRNSFENLILADTHTHIYTYTHIYTDTQTHRHTDTQTHRHTYTYTQNLHTHTHTYTQTHTHTYTYTQNLPTQTHAHCTKDHKTSTGTERCIPPLVFCAVTIIYREYFKAGRRTCQKVPAHGQALLCGFQKADNHQNKRNTLQRI